MKWNIYDIQDLKDERADSGRPYLPFMDVPSMRAGLYELAAGAEDKQQPHEEDEIYYVLEGRAEFEVDGELKEVRKGSVIFVKAGVEHRFVRIEKALSLLVVFAGSKD